MSFRDCILAKIAEGKLSERKGKELTKKYDDAVKKYMSAGTPEGAAALAADDMLQMEVSRVQKKQRNIMVHATKMKQFNDKFKASSEPIAKQVGNEYDTTYVRVDTVRHDLERSLAQFADELSVNAAGLGRNYEGVAKAVLHVLGENVDDPNARAFGEALTKMFDLAHERATNAGLIIGKVKNYFPRVHKKEAILALKVDMTTWREDIKRHIDPATAIDRETGMPMTPQRLDEALSSMYDSIMSDGRSKLVAAAEAGDRPKGFGGGDLDTSWDDQRFFEFKSPKDFLEYNRKYGVGDEGLPSLIINHINAISRDIALAEKLGPRAYDMARFFDFKMEVANAPHLQRRLQNAKFRTMAGLMEVGNVDSVFYKSFTGLQNWSRASLLTGGILNAIPDSSVMAISAKYNGLEATSVLKNALAGLAPGSNETKKLAKKLNFIHYTVAGSAIGDTRFAGEGMGEGIPRYLANMMNQINGVGRWTNAAQDGVALEMLEQLGAHINSKTSFDKLDPFMRQSMQKFDITEADWGALKDAELMPHGDVMVLNTSDMRVDKALIEKLGKERVKDLADKVDDWVFYMRKTVTTEPTLGTRAVFSGAIFGEGIDSRTGGPGTPERYLMSALGLFKSYPFSYMALHLAPAIKRIDMSNLRSFDRLALLAIGTTLSGAAVVQIKQLANGLMPKEWRPTEEGGVKFWKQALAQGGGLGPLGDFLFQDQSRYGRGPFEQALGPAVGTVNDLYKATKGNLDNENLFDEEGRDQVERNVSRDLFRVMKRNLPLVRVWYSKLLVERLLLDNLERMIDPSFDRRIGKYERRIEKESGQQFWWRPGETKPDLAE